MTTGAYIEALAIGGERFRTLRRIHCALNPKGEPIFCIKKNEIIFEVSIEGKRALLRCGGNYEKKIVLTKIENPYRLLTAEMLIFDASNRSSWVDVIVEEPAAPAPKAKVSSIYVDFKECEFVGNISDTLIRICQNGEWGFADRLGNRIIRLQFSDADDFYEGRARIRVGSGYGVIDREGGYVMQPRYEQLEWWGRCNVISASYNGEWKLYDRVGRPLTKASYNWMGECSEGVFVVERDGKFGYVRTNGIPITPLRYDEAYSFADGEALAIMGGISYRIKK